MMSVAVPVPSHGHVGASGGKVVIVVGGAVGASVGWSVGDTVGASVPAGAGVRQRLRVSPGPHGRRVSVGNVLAMAAAVVAAPLDPVLDKGPTETHPVTNITANGKTNRSFMALPPAHGSRSF
jgi:hypothetical protein